ncbi:Cytochrome p450, partial [Globisporangium splendens]
MSENSALHALCTPAVLAVTGVVVLLGYLAFPSAAERAVRHLPQPATTLPVVYNTFDIMFRYPGRIYDFLLDETRKQNGQIWRVKAMGRPVTIVLTSPAAFEHVLKTKFEDFGKGELNSITLYDVLGKGIFAVDGMLWMHQRKTASHLFSLQMMRDTMEHTVMHYTEILCERLAEIAETKETVNVKRMLDLFTMDVFTKIGFGVNLHGLESNENPELLDAFERASLNLLSRFQVPVWSWQLRKWLNIGKEKQMAKDVQVINDFTLNVIKRSMEQARTKSDADTKSKDLISLFLEKESTGYSNGEYNGSVDTDATLIRDMTMSFLAAGRDTTSQSMAWFILMLNRSPPILARVRQEIYDKLPKLRSGAAITSAPSMEDVQQLTFLEAALRESIRLNPVVAMNARTALRDTTLHDGTFIKAGTRVALPHYAMARLTQVWGDDAEVYNPDRWIDPATGKLIEVSPFKFTAFLGGPRMCLGMKFALLEMKIAMAAVLSKFDFTTERDPMAYTYRPSITLTIRGPVNVTVRSVDAATATEQ